MRTRAAITLILLATPLLCHCGGGTNITSSGSSNPGYGPFDRHGNYVEEWADKPAKKHWWARKPKPAPAKEEPKVASTTKPEKSETKPTRSTQVAALSRPTMPRDSSSASSRPTTTPPPRPKPTVASTPPAPKPKPKPTPVKPKAPPPIRHTVVKGDTLYNLSRRYGTSVSAIQRANGIKGTTIRLGQRLVIPRG